ncbi:hypothetical protein [Methylovirgula sp. 4M-Z18]|uniref:hypothetical protein n=1 Tax=Methylovirgula sp. 4M-Z18 TaxID=2293567 RepID=UPI000E2EC3ED|nr:hypothetical protein [Methylovirgula sp. 4M-Z18]RFB81232.1 hypothetical protein DYH55_07260 [Methylovirgula sp. 4M-Z18]
MTQSIGFIFMATRHDRTVPDARARIEDALAAGVRNIGFKDIGLPAADLKELTRAIQAGGAEAFLEVVSLQAEDELGSARAAVDLGVDWLLGGVRADDVAPIIAGSGIRYAPFPGRIVGHPSVLEGSIAEIAESARRLTDLEAVAGLDLLAYRHAGDVPALMRAVIAAAPKPVIVAGSIDSPERIHTVFDCGAAGFTIGTCALDEAFPAPSPGFPAQLKAIQEAVLAA